MIFRSPYDREFELEAEIEHEAYQRGARDMLNKLSAEIERQEKWLMDAGYNAYNVDIAFSSIKSVVAELRVRNDNN